MSTQSELLRQLWNDLDTVTTGVLRFFAGRSSHRSFIGRLKAVLTGVAAFPLLPMARESAAPGAIDASSDTEEPALREMGDEKSCDY